MNDVVTGGPNMVKKGYKAYSSPGRHIMGSNVFWYFNAVCGGQTEYSADMDCLDDNWKPRVSAALSRRRYVAVPVERHHHPAVCAARKPLVSSRVRAQNSRGSR